MGKVIFTMCVFYIGLWFLLQAMDLGERSLRESCNDLPTVSLRISCLEINR